MPGLVPGIHVFLFNAARQNVDGRDICAKTRFALCPAMTLLRVVVAIPIA
jgi:hypothetical protein